MSQMSKLNEHACLHIENEPQRLFTLERMFTDRV